jgi:hypothetical protein
MAFHSLQSQRQEDSKAILVRGNWNIEEDKTMARIQTTDEIRLNRRIANIKPPLVMKSYSSMEGMRSSTFEVELLQANVLTECRWVLFIAFFRLKGIV